MDENEIYDLLKRRSQLKMRERENARVGESMGPDKQIGNLLLGLGAGFSSALTKDQSTVKDVLGTYNRDDSKRINALDKDDGLADILSLYKVKQTADLQRQLQEMRDRSALTKQGAADASLDKRLGASDAMLDKRLKAQNDMLDKRLRAQRAGGAQGKITATQGLVAGYARRLEQAQADLLSLSDSGYERGSRMEAFSKAVRPEAFETQEQKLQEQAERNFINAVLRRESGAAIAPSEFDNAAKQYFPRSGDGPEVLAQKLRNRQQVIESFKAEAGRALDQFPKIQDTSPNPRISNAGMTKISNGRETVFLDPKSPTYANDLAEAKAEGFKEVGF